MNVISRNAIWEAAAGHPAATMTEYQSLLLDFTPQPIDNEREYQRALKYIDRNRAAQLPKAKALLLDLLATLVADYEERHLALPDLTPGELIKFLIDERRMTQSELARQTGIPCQKISNAINGTGALSKGNAIKLAEFFKLRPSAFVE